MPTPAAFPFAGGLLSPAHDGGAQAGQYSMITAQSIDALGCALLVGELGGKCQPQQVANQGNR